MDVFDPRHKAKRLRIYIGESDQWRGRPLYLALLDWLKQAGFAGATVVRGVAGFGAHSRIHTASILDLSEDLPIVIEVVDRAEKIERAMETVKIMVREGLVTLEEVDVIFYTHRYLHPIPADRLVSEIMTSDPLSTRVQEPLPAVWRSMLAFGIKALPVLDDQQRVTGILTHTDLLDRAGLSARLAAAQRLDEATLQAEFEVLSTSGLTAGAVMASPVVTISPDASVQRAADLLVRHKFTRLPVVDEQGHLLGMISRLDLLRQVLDLPGQIQPTPTTPAPGRLAGEVMRLDVPSVGKDAKLPEMVDALLKSSGNRLVVVDLDGKPMGLISDSDVVSRVAPTYRRGILSALRGRGAVPDLSVTAVELMSPGVETISPETSLVSAVQRMVLTGRKWLVVIDPSEKILGMLDRETALQAFVI